MAIPADQPGEPELPPAALRELDALLSQLCDELLDVEDVSRLGRLLAAEPAARRRYYRHVALHSTLVGAAGGLHDVGGKDDAPPVLAVFDGEPCGPIDAHEEVASQFHSARPRLRPAAWAAAVILLSVGTAAWRLYAPEAGERQRATGWVPADASPSLATSSLVAEISNVSPALRWQRSNESYSLTSRVRAGQSLALASGSIELTYDSGTTLTLTGPSEFVVDDNGGMLQRGEIVAHVTEMGHGFTIRTPHGKIVDRGTDFGVVVDDFGISEVNVFRGRVEAFPVAGSGPPAPKIELTTGRMLQWSGESIISVNAAHRTLPDLSPEAAQGAPQVTPTVLLDVPPGAEPLAPHQWKTLGAVRMPREGLQLDGRADPTERPYLIAAHQCDPSLGPIVISCDVRFDDIEPDVQPAFSILTRAADERSKPATPWCDMLANCVRCSLKADPSSGEGVLEAGAKYEFDREPSTISWRGFVRPRAGVTYHIQMRDDGLNVSFTASESGNASVSKTVTCRSLFRGLKNFVALEGFVGGVATVTNMRITQVRNQLSAETNDEPQPPIEVAVGDLPGAAIEQVFADSIPAGAQLRIVESFESQDLDRDRWITLGDVDIAGGALRLGVANSEQHIDTWRQRPYLLTRERFEPAKAALTIIGRASFASNFLYGYGGSFAVLTRAEADYGTGPGWEQSALRRGLRANLWPAALGQNRSLELFEMLSPEPLNLLAMTDFPIDPESRSYLFCVQDDGAAARLTLVDDQNRNLRKTLAHATQSPLLASGHIAFEGCWGAPVQLDDVRIYESPTPAMSQPVEHD